MMVLYNMKQITAYLILAAMCTLSLSCRSQNFAGGDGTAKKPYLIETKEQLIMFADKVNSDSSFSTGKYFALKKDVSLNGDTLFHPIGKSNGYAFRGCFDGKLHCITNVSENIQSVFLYNKGVVKNLVHKESALKGCLQASGICAFNDSIIENCINYATVAGKDGEKGGGIAGICVFNRGLISRCANYGIITGKIFNTGGICAFNSGLVENCLNEAKISGNTRTGGICGYNKGFIKNCLSLADVSGQKETGAICGSNDIENEFNKETLRRDKIKQSGTIENCFFSLDSCKIEPIGTKAEKAIDSNVMGYTSEWIVSHTLFNDTANWIEKKGRMPKINNK